MFLNFILPTLITIIGIVLFVLVSYTLYKKNNKYKYLPVKILWILMVVFEVIKISYLIHEDMAFYPNRYPLVFCSLVMYSIPIFIFKENKYSNLARLFTIFTSLFVIIAYFAVCFQYTMSIMQAHSYFYHGAMASISIYLIAIKDYKYNFNDYFKLFLIVGSYIVFNAILGMYLNTYISLFGPTSAYLGFLHNIFGFVPATLILLTILYLLCLLTFVIIRNVRKKKGAN